MTDQLVFDAPLSPDSFAGRKAVVEQICERLCRPQFQSSTVVGGPKMGKTSLFRFLCSSAADSYFAKRSLVRLYFDAQIVGSNSTEQDFWLGVLKGLANLAADKPMAKMVNEKITKGSSSRLTKFDIVDIFDGFASAQMPVALFVDNFDTPLRNDNFWTGSDFFHNLRFFDEREPRGLCYVVATCRPLRDYWRPAAVSPFFNTWINFLLNPLTTEQLDEWVDRWLHNTKPADKKIIHELVGESSYGHPFIVNFVLGICLEQSRTGHRPAPAIIDRNLGQPEGPGPLLIRRIMAELVPFERDMVRSIPETQTLAPAKVRALQRLASYGMLPPGTVIPAEAAE